MSRTKVAKLPIPLESDVQKTCLAILGARGVIAWRNNKGAFGATRNGKRHYVKYGGLDGASDLFCVVPSIGGRFMTIEIKRPGKYPTVAQIAFMRMINEAKGISFWVSSGDQLDAILDHVLDGGSVRVNEAGSVFAE